MAHHVGAALSLSRWSDVVVIYKPRETPWLFAAMARTGARLFVDIDDAVWASGSSPTAAVRAASIERARRFDAAAAHAEAVVTGSAHLAAEVAARVAGSATQVVRTPVDLESYDTTTERSDHRPCRLGWIGTATNLRDFGDDVVDALRKVVSTERASLTIIADRPLEREALDATFVPWSLAGEVDALAQIDIGLMPLLDDDRSRGRCAFKAIQHFATSTPVIASPVGAAPELVIDGHTGYLASTTDEWLGVLSTLIDDPEARARMGAEARGLVEREASTSVATERWLRLLTGRDG
jgi:glycosyltransferase involved in cell wall biosynthesis